MHAKLERQSQDLNYRQRHVTFFTSQLSLSPGPFGGQASLSKQILPTTTAKPDKLYGIDETACVTRAADDRAVTNHLYRILSTHEMNDDLFSSPFNYDKDNPTWIYIGNVSILKILPSNKLWLMSTDPSCLFLSSISEQHSRSWLCPIQSGVLRH